VTNEELEEEVTERITGARMLPPSISASNVPDAPSSYLGSVFLDVLLKGAYLSLWIARTMEQLLHTSPSDLLNCWDRGLIENGRQQATVLANRR
jgi:hypothetical protein